MQACKRYHAMLLRVYGNNLVLDPHVMDVSALKDYTADGMPPLRPLPCSAMLQGQCSPLESFSRSTCTHDGLYAWHHLVGGRQNMVVNPVEDVISVCPANVCR